MRGYIYSLSVFLGLVLVLLAGTAFCGDFGLRIGDRVRLELFEQAKNLEARGPVVGKVVSITQEQIEISRNDGLPSLALDWPNISSVEKLVGYRSKAGGAGLGAGIGFGIGFGLGLLSGDSHPDSAVPLTGGTKGLLLGILFMPFGALIGTDAQSEGHWEKQEVEAGSLGVWHSPDGGMGLLVQIGF